MIKGKFTLQKLGPKPSLSEIDGLIETRRGGFQEIDGQTWELVDISPANGGPTMTGYVPLKQIKEQ